MARLLIARKNAVRFILPPYLYNGYGSSLAGLAQLPGLTAWAVKVGSIVARGDGRKIGYPAGRGATYNDNAGIGLIDLGLDF
jgi:hypothetical protein